MHITINKIAELAGVSRGTVDKVLHNRPGVSDDVRAKINRILEEAAYKPNRIGKALANFNNRRTIGIIVTPEDNPFIEDIKKGIYQAYGEISDFGLDIDYMAMTSNDPGELAGLIRLLMERRVSALMVPTYDSAEVREALGLAAAAGIAIATFLSDLPGIQRICFVGHDLEKGGRVAGQLMGKMLRGGGRVAILSGPSNMTAHRKRVGSFCEEIGTYRPAITITETIDISDSDAKGYRVTGRLLAEHPDLAGLYITGAGVAGICRAIVEAGRAGKVRVVCFDFVPTTKEYVKDGVIDFAIGQDPFFEGYTPVKVLAEYLMSGKLPERDVIHTKVDIRIRENID